MVIRLASATLTNPVTRHFDSCIRPKSHCGGVNTAKAEQFHLKTSFVWKKTKKQAPCFPLCLLSQHCLHFSPPPTPFFSFDGRGLLPSRSDRLPDGIPRVGCRVSFETSKKPTAHYPGQVTVYREGRPCVATEAQRAIRAAHFEPAHMPLWWRTGLSIHIRTLSSNISSKRLQ